MTIKDSKILITGGSSGIGKETARLLIEKGATVIITGRNKGSLTRLINVMEKNGLVKRIASKEDSRKNLVFITENGKKTFAKMKPIMLENIKL